MISLEKIIRGTLSPDIISKKLGEKYSLIL